MSTLEPYSKTKQHSNKQQGRGRRKHSISSSSKQVEAAAGTDTVSYSAAYTTGGLVIGFQGDDADKSSYSATYTVVPGMQFEIGSLDNGTTSTSSAELQMTF